MNSLGARILAVKAPQKMMKMSHEDGEEKKSSNPHKLRSFNRPKSTIQGPTNLYKFNPSTRSWADVVKEAPQKQQRFVAPNTILSFLKKAASSSSDESSSSDSEGKPKSISHDQLNVLSDEGEEETGNLNHSWSHGDVHDPAVQYYFGVNGGDFPSHDFAATSGSVTSASHIVVDPEDPDWSLQYPIPTLGRVNNEQVHAQTPPVLDDIDFSEMPPLIDLIRPYDEAGAEIGTEDHHEDDISARWPLEQPEDIQPVDNIIGHESNSHEVLEEPEDDHYVGSVAGQPTEEFRGVFDTTTENGSLRGNMWSLEQPEHVQIINPEGASFDDSVAFSDSIVEPAQSQGHTWPLEVAEDIQPISVDFLAAHSAAVDSNHLGPLDGFVSSDTDEDDTVFRVVQESTTDNHDDVFRLVYTPPIPGAGLEHFEFPSSMMAPHGHLHLQAQAQDPEESDDEQESPPALMNMESFDSSNELNSVVESDEMLLLHHSPMSVHDGEAESSVETVIVDNPILAALAAAVTTEARDVEDAEASYLDDQVPHQEHEDQDMNPTADEEQEHEDVVSVSDDVIIHEDEDVFGEFMSHHTFLENFDLASVEQPLGFHIEEPEASNGSTVHFVEDESDPLLSSEALLDGQVLDDHGIIDGMVMTSDSGELSATDAFDATSVGPVRMTTNVSELDSASVNSFVGSNFSPNFALSRPTEASESGFVAAAAAESDQYTACVVPSILHPDEVRFASDGEEEFGDRSFDEEFVPKDHEAATGGSDTFEEIPLSRAFKSNSALISKHLFKASSSSSDSDSSDSSSSSSDSSSSSESTKDTPRIAKEKSSSVIRKSSTTPVIKVYPMSREEAKAKKLARKAKKEKSLILTTTPVSDDTPVIDIEPLNATINATSEITESSARLISDDSTNILMVSTGVVASAILLLVLAKKFLFTTVVTVSV